MTITEIARHFDVSAVTVSNALNRKKGVAAEKAEEIRRYAEAHGYQPSYLAKSLLNGQTSLVGLCLRGPLTDPWYAALINDIQCRLFEHGLYLNTITAYQSGLTQEQAVERERWVLGFFRQIKAEVVAIGPLDGQRCLALGDAVARQADLVMFGCTEPLDGTWLGLDIGDGCRQALGCLHANGHRRIGYLGANRFDETYSGGETRFSAYCDYLQRHGMPFEKRWIIHGNGWNTPEEIVPAFRRLLASGGELPSAYFCHSDNFALVAAKTLAEFNLHVPDDVSLVGFDNQPVAALAMPGFTTVGFNLEHYAGKLVECVLEKVRARRSGKLEFERWSYSEPAQLIVRNSVRKVAAPDQGRRNG